MNTKILFVGLDVDDQNFHAAATSEDGSERFEFCCKPNVKSLLNKLNPFIEKGFTIRICYEATFLGFSLARVLRSKGLFCEVIAPSLIPVVSGPRIKTDRLDCRKLAEYYRTGLLTVVHEPDEEDEKVRDLVRSRSFLMSQLHSTKRHILSICRRMGLDYRQEKEKPTAAYWTDKHFSWLEAQQGHVTNAVKANLQLMMIHLRQLEGQLAGYDEQIRLIAESGKYQDRIRALSCFRGISSLTAMLFIAELGDIRRFKHPRQLTSYAGLDLSEYSSGGNEFRLRITKMGNKFIRTAAVECSQSALFPPKISRELTWRRKGVNPKFVAIADRCMNRLYQKSRKLLATGKHRNKVKIACARELLGFIWETLHAVQVAA